MKKRILSIIISILMVISLIPSSSFAEKLSTNNDTGITQIEENNNKQENEGIKKSSDKVKKENIGTPTENIDKAKENEDITKNNDVTNQIDIQTQTNLQIDNQNDPLEVNSSYDDFNRLERKKWLKYLEEKGIQKNKNTTIRDNHLYNEETQKVFFNGEYNVTSVTTSPMVMFRRIPEKKTNVKKRYTVLVLDISSSMEGKAIESVKIATKKFCDAVLKDKAQNYVAIVPYNTNVPEELVVNFTNDKSTLIEGIDRLSTGRVTNMNEGLEYAGKLLFDIKDEKGTVKNIILLSDGLPNEGKELINGKYSYDDDYGYKYANACYETTLKFKNIGYKIYSLGFFHNSFNDGLHDPIPMPYEEDFTFARKFMNDLQNAGYYDVTEPDKIEFVFGEIADAITEKVGKFKYPGTVDGRDHESTYVYKDSYFRDSSYIYNQNLATMSLCLELSSWASSSESEYGNKSVNARNLFSEIGFSEFRQNDRYYSKPTMDSIGVVAANKKITVNGEEYTLIALAIRGGGYESEWASNFTIGMSGFHSGFNNAKIEVENFLEKQVMDCRI